MFTEQTVRPQAVAAARALATRLADWGPMIAAKFAVKSDREVTAGDRARFNLVLVGAAPFNTLAGALTIPMPDTRPLGDRAFRAVVPDPHAPSRYALVFGALTPSGFAQAAALRAPQPGRLGAREQPFVHVVRELAASVNARARACEQSHIDRGSKRTKQCR